MGKQGHVEEGYYYGFSGLRWKSKNSVGFTLNHAPPWLRSNDTEQIDKKDNCLTLLRTSTSLEHETNVIARPLVPNLPARPTCLQFHPE
jgi:hypothetical protein